MRNFFQKIDAIINKIPKHIQDIIRKASLALFALIALIGIVIGIQNGFDSATPGGFKMVENSKDLFYLQQLRAENEKKRVLTEDVDIDTMRFSSNMKESIEKFNKMGTSTENRFLNTNEKISELEEDIDLRKKDPGFLSDEQPFSNSKKNLDTGIRENDILELKKEEKPVKEKTNKESVTDDSAPLIKSKRENKRKLDYILEE